MSESTLGELVSNTYNDGKGVAVFEDPIECIEENAFEYCETLQKIVIPSSDTEVSMSAFRGCVNIKAIYVPQGCVDFYKEFFPRYMSWVGMFSDSGYMNFETECHGVSSRSNHGWKEQD